MSAEPLATLVNLCIIMLTLRVLADKSGFDSRSILEGACV